MSYFPSITQNTVIDTANSNSGTLGAGLTWNAAGTGTSTLGFQGIQIVVQSTQNMQITVEQGITNSTFQISDDYLYNVIKGDFGITIKIVSPYVRVSIKNTGSSSATYSINTTLTPITEPIPRSLDSNVNGDHLKVGVYEVTDQWGNSIHVSPAGWMDVNQPYRLVGTAFGSAIDANFWTATNNGTGSASGVATSIATITSGTGANAWAQMFTIRLARFIFNNAMKTKQLILIPIVTTANTNRYWGAMTATAGSAGVLPTVIDGFYFNLNGSGVLSVNSRNNGGTVNSISSGSFNGEVSTYIVDTNVHAYEIVYYIAKCQFYIDNQLIHTFTPTTAPLTATCTLQLGTIATTSGTNSGSIQMWAGTIHRLGRDLTCPIYRHQAGALANTVIKIGAGTLRAVVINQWLTGTTISLYDSATTTNAIALIVPTTIGGTHQELPMTLTYGIEFYTGLTLTVVGGSTDVTVIYE